MGFLLSLNAAVTSPDSGVQVSSHSVTAPAAHTLNTLHTRQWILKLQTNLREVWSCIITKKAPTRAHYVLGVHDPISCLRLLYIPWVHRYLNVKTVEVYNFKLREDSLAALPADSWYNASFLFTSKNWFLFHVNRSLFSTNCSFSVSICLYWNLILWWSITLRLIFLYCDRIR